MYYFIINPASAKGSGRNTWNELIPLIEGEQIPYRRYFTEKDRGADLIMEKLLGKDREEITVFVMGGDGTVNSFLHGMRAYEKAHPDDDPFKRVKLAYVPVGSANDMAKALEYPEKPADAFLSVMDKLKNGAFRKMDIGSLTYIDPESESLKDEIRYFAVSCGIGFDASVCAEAMNSKMKKVLNGIGLGKLSYGGISVKQLMTSQMPDVEVTTGGETKNVKSCMMVTVMNHKYQGGGVMFTPDAVDDDGKLDFLYTEEMKRTDIAKILPKAYSGAHVGTPGIVIGTTEEIRIKSPDPLYVHTDGEVETRAKEILVKVCPGRLTFAG